MSDTGEESDGTYTVEVHKVGKKSKPHNTEPNIEVPKLAKKSKPINSEPKAIKRPKTSAMVLTAIGTLNEKGGSSLQAIKKFVLSTYNIDTDTSARFIKKYLKTAVESGELTQTNGTGARGSFKIKATPKPPQPPKLDAKVKKKVSDPKKKDVIKVATKKVTAGVVKKPKVSLDAKTKSKKAIETEPKPKSAPSKSTSKPKKVKTKIDK